MDLEFERLLECLKTRGGFDFTGYKRPSLLRRVRKRMLAVGIDGFPAYGDYLEGHPEEVRQLLHTVLINVTGFFRDPGAWAVLRQEYLPELLSAKRADEPIRVWSAGCASGEEAYSLAIAIAEAIGVEALRGRVKVFATDLDEHALAQARRGAYAEADLSNLGPALRERYSDRVGEKLVVRGELRRLLVFGRHDLINDAPISRLDLLSCRNALMYFDREVQSRILARFHFALRDGGYLFLGRAEMMHSHASLFPPVSLGARIFTKSARPSSASSAR